MTKSITKNKKHYEFYGIRINHYLLASLIVGIAVLLCAPLSTPQTYYVVSYILLFVVSLLSTIMAIGPVFLASALSALVWNFFFIPPNLTFHIDKTEDVLMFCMFFIIALLNGVFTTRIRKQKQLASEREIRTNALFQITKGLSKASGIDEVLIVAINEIKHHFNISSLFILQDGNNILSSSGRLQKEKKLTANEYAIAEWTFKNTQKAGAFTSEMNNVDYTFYPLVGSRINTGVVAVKQEKNFTPEQKVFWETFVTLISNALEREFLGELVQKARFLDESDRLYKTLFNSISHELRIPVATIMGASDTLANSTQMNNMQNALCNEIVTASIRLNRLIDNLLNMSRLESGRLSVRLDWYDINDLIYKVVDDLQNELKPFNLTIVAKEDVPLIKIDFGLIEQVLYNLLFNATQHAPVASEIKLCAFHKNNRLTITISDCGPGIPEQYIANLFKKFFRVDNNKSGGIGLGLSIVKGFVEAHKGTVSVQNNDTGGATFTVEIPSEQPRIDNMPIDHDRK